MHKILLLFFCILGVSLGTQAQVTLNTSLEHYFVRIQTQNSMF